MAVSSTTPVSVASGSSTGASGGSVIDVATLVSQLVAADAAPQQALIANQTQSVTAKISAVGALKSALSTFQSSLSALADPNKFGSTSATSSNPAAVTASVGAGAVNGSYNVAVSTLASAQQLLSKPVAANGTASVGTGTLTLSLGGKSFDVTINSTNNTVNGVAAAINAAAGSAGVAAAVITGTDGVHLLLSSNLTGAANTIQVTENDGTTALAALTYVAGNTDNYRQNAAAADAAFSVAGVAYTSATNTVRDAVTGVTLNLHDTTSSAGNATVTVASDLPAVEANVSQFVTAYNTLYKSLQSLGSYDATTGSAGSMQGNSLLTGIQNSIRQALSGRVGQSTYNSLPSIGITTSRDGTLSLDGTKLATALSTDFTAVSSLFSAKTGIATQLNSLLTTDLSSTGTIANASATLISQENALTVRTNTLNAQSDAMTARLTQQFSALNTLLSSLRTTSAYLTQALASLPTVQGKSNA